MPVPIARQEATGGGSFSALKPSPAQFPFGRAVGMGRHVWLRQSTIRLAPVAPTPRRSRRRL